MKCLYCNGTGEIKSQFPDLMTTCPMCGGKGKVEQTNFEFLQGCTMEEAVVALCEMDKWIKQKIKGEIGGYNKYFKGDYYREWLREEHKE